MKITIASEVEHMVDPPPQVDVIYVRVMLPNKQWLDIRAEDGSVHLMGSSRIHLTPGSSNALELTIPNR